ncbi:MAG: ATP-binding protein [Bacteroidales bacterium]|nr:ATP-binding protein [Bacteroidales bacterium]
MAKSKDGREFSFESNFIYVVSDGYYVDKTLFIKELIDDYPKHRSMLFTRPRRFGKSLNLSMIRTFFEKTDEDTSVYFKDLEIWKCGEKYTSEQGKYPVIYLDFKAVDISSWQEMFSSIKRCIGREYRRFDFIETGLKEDDAEIFRTIGKETAGEASFADSLRFLSEALFIYYGVKPIILIDEYDVPVQKGYEEGYYSDVIKFIRSLFSSAFKGTDLKITFAVITGAMRISKESMFTGLNNLGEYSVLDDEYSQYFGFTKEEIIKILVDFNHPEKEKEICDWYDGYHFGKTDIFNPWSVSKYVTKNFTPAAYWLKSSENSIMMDLLRNPTDKDVETLRGLNCGEPITDDITDDISYGDLNKMENDRQSAIYSVMLMTGYLTPEYDDLGLRQFVIPNEEVRRIYSREILKYLWGGRGPGFGEKIKKALAHGSAGMLEKALQEALNTSTSYLDLPKGTKEDESDREKVYHAFVDGLSYAIDDEYMVRSNEESGLGRFDISYLPRNVSGVYPGVIIEFETAKSEKDMDAEAEEALSQIEDKMYDAKLKDAGVTRIDKYAMVFFGKKVKVVKKA